VGKDRSHKGGVRNTCSDKGVRLDLLHTQRDFSDKGEERKERWRITFKHNHRVRRGEVKKENGVKGGRKKRLPSITNHGTRYKDLRLRHTDARNGIYPDRSNRYSFVQSLGEQLATGGKRKGAQRGK